MTCNGCKRDDAHRVSYSSSGETCNFCGSLGSFKFSDVYFDQKRGEHFNPNLADPNKSPLGNVVRSREHKAQLMRELGVKESGDRIHGARGTGLRK